jgi:hypothetical protein
VSDENPKVAGAERVENQGRSLSPAGEEVVAELEGRARGKVLKGTVAEPDERAKCIFHCR